MANEKRFAMDKETPNEETDYPSGAPALFREIKSVMMNDYSVRTAVNDTTLTGEDSLLLVNKASAVAVTLPDPTTAASATCFKRYLIKNLGAGVCTITGSVTLNGVVTSNPTLAQYDEISLWVDATTFYGMKFSSSRTENSVYVQGSPEAMRGAYRYSTKSGSFATGQFTKVALNASLYDTDNMSNVSSQTCSMTIASPGVITAAGHGLAAGDPFYLSSTGAVPTGLTTTQIYHVIAAGLTADAFQVSLTVGGAAINTSGTQSGVHTLYKNSHLFTIPAGVTRARFHALVGVDLIDTGKYASLEIYRASPGRSQFAVTKLGISSLFGNPSSGDAILISSPPIIVAAGEVYYAYYYNNATSSPHSVVGFAGDTNPCHLYMAIEIVE